MGRTIVSGLLTALLLSGCVGKLQTTPNRGYTPVGSALLGVSYALPKVRYEVKLTRALAECPGDKIDGKPTALKFSVSATATPSFVAGESYSVRYEKLPDWLRTGSFEIKWYPNGTLKSLGAGAEDKTGEVLSDIAKTAISVASIVGLSSGGEIRATLPKQIVTCTDQASADVREARQVETDLKTKAGLLESYQKASERFLAASAARALDGPGRALFLTLFDNISTVETDIAKLKKRQTELTEKLGVTETINWDGGADVPSYNQDYPLSQGQLAKLLKLLQPAAMPPPADYPLDPAELKRQTVMTNCYNDKADPRGCLSAQLDLRSGLWRDRPLTCGENGADATECLTEVAASDSRYRNARDAVPDSGIFVREPMIGRLLFCRISLVEGAPSGTQPAVAPALPPATGTQPATSTGGNSEQGTQGGGFEGSAGRNPPVNPPVQNHPQPEKQTCAVDKDEAKIAAGDFPQFGQLRYLPLRVGTFQAREMAVSLTESGRLDSFSYKSTKAPAQVLASTAADAASKSQDYFEKRETERRDDLKAARDEEIAAIQQEITKLTKEQELKKLLTPADVDPLKATRDETAAIEADLALARAKLERLKTQRELAAMQ